MRWFSRKDCRFAFGKSDRLSVRELKKDERETIGEKEREKGNGFLFSPSVAAIMIYFKNRCFSHGLFFSNGQSGFSASSCKTQSNQ